MAIAVGRVSFLPNHLKQGRLGGWIPDGTSGRRIHGWLKPPSKPPENLSFSPLILRRGEDEAFTVIQTRVLNRFQGGPGIDNTLFDLHERNEFKVRDFLDIRWCEGNLLASPYFPRSGGMLVDWIDPAKVEANGKSWT